LSAPEREVTSPSDFKVVGALPSSYSNETMPNAEQFMLTLSEHQTIQPVLVRVYMAHALVLVVFVSNYVVVLFSFDIVTNVLISPCIFLLIAYII
jgi:hypothetical protein